MSQERAELYQILSSLQKKGILVKEDSENTRLAATSPRDRHGLGYGQTYNKFQYPKPEDPVFPYVSEDPYEDDEDIDIGLGDDVDIFIRKSNNGYTPVDSLAANSTDRGYYVAGNTRGLTGIIEIAASNSMVPFPDMYKSKQMVAGGFTQQQAYKVGPHKRTGTLKGYAKSPDPVKGLPEDDIRYDSLVDILSDDELAVYKAVIGRLASLAGE